MVVVGSVLRHVPNIRVISASCDRGLDGSVSERYPKLRHVELYLSSISLLSSVCFLKKICSLRYRCGMFVSFLDLLDRTACLFISSFWVLSLKHIFKSNFSFCLWVLKWDNFFSGSEPESVKEEWSAANSPVWLQLLLSTWYAIISHSELVCYFVIFLHQLRSPTLLSLPLPLMVFLWGSLTMPRPTKTFWITLIAYTEV